VEGINNHELTKQFVKAFFDGHANYEELVGNFVKSLPKKTKINNLRIENPNLSDNIWKTSITLEIFKRQSYSNPLSITYNFKRGFKKDVEQETGTIESSYSFNMTGKVKDGELIDTLAGFYKDNQPKEEGQ